MTVMACMTLQKAHMAGNSQSDKLVRDVNSATTEVSVDDEPVWRYLLEGVMWNSSARIEANDNSDPNIKEPWLTRGNVTEQGLFKFFMGMLGGQGALEKKNALTEENTVSVIQFTSSRKRASIVVRNPEKEGTDREIRIYCKGAPDMVLENTTQVLCADGSVQSLED
jgi:magnesium-transporting ATPase (P-type)